MSVIFSTKTVIGNTVLLKRTVTCNVLLVEFLAVLTRIQYFSSQQKKHADKFDGLTGKIREDKFNKLNLNLDTLRFCQHFS